MGQHQVYAALWRESRLARCWRHKLLIWFKPPGWQSAEMAARAPRPPFDIQRVSATPLPVSAKVRRFAALQFGLLLTGSGVFLWFNSDWPIRQSATWFAVLLAGLWALGAVLQNRTTRSEALMIENAALSMATEASGLLAWHWVSNP